MPLNTWTPTESGTSLPTILPTTKAPFHLGCPGADFAPTQKHTTQSIMHNRLPLASTFHHYPPPPNQPMPPPANIIPQFWIVSLVRASMHSNESMHHHQTWTPHHPSPNTPILPLPPKMTPNSSRSRPTLNRHPLNKLALAFPSAATLPTESFPRLATQFLPTDFLLALHRASSVHGPLTASLPYRLPTNQPTPPTLPSPPPIFF
jgi:hypothetical protein